MPKFERAKGKFHYEIGQHGHVVSVREWAGDDQRLTGYCMFPDAATASMEFERLLRTKSSEGFLPVDAAAKALAASLKLEGPKPKTAPQLPLRQDIHVYNEATRFAIGSLKLAGKGMEDGDRIWNKAVNDGLLIPVSLYQDDSFCLRVVAGDILNEQEREEWVGRLEWRLKLARGPLCISGGSEWVYEGYDPDDAGDDNFVRILDVPPGHYRATLYSYLSGVNGEACLDELSGGMGKSEPVGQWFRRTRPDEPFPEWMASWCVAYPDSDPGHEKEWQGKALPDRQSTPEFVDFLLHLEPAEPPTKPVKAQTTGGWFSPTEGARKPELCPIGLRAQNVMGHEKKAEGKWVWPREIFPMVEAYSPTPLSGGAVAVPLDQLVDVYRLGKFCHRNLLPELRATLREGEHFPLEGAWPEDFLALAEGNYLRFTIPPGASEMQVLQAATERLKLLPDGTILELAISVLHNSPPKAERPIGTHRYAGTVMGGVWHIDQTFPPADAEALRAALALAAEARACNGFKVRSDDEAAKIQQWCKSNLGIFIADNPPLHEGGFIRLKEPKPADYSLVGGAVFTARFAPIWRVFEFAPA